MSSAKFFERERSRCWPLRSKPKSAEWIESHREHLENEQGHRQVIRNGHLPKRQIITGVGPLEVRQPRVRDRRSSH